jgi:hypothetical protein
MIHYQLRCGAGHAFDGWFRDSAAFEQQTEAGYTTCPVCGAADVKRALMAPALGKKGRKPPAQIEASAVAAPERPPTPIAGGELPDGMRAMLQKLRAEVEKKCDYVGSEFAAEARRIHSGASEKRGIYGEASPEDAERLADDGIDVAQIPWVPRADG